MLGARGGGGGEVSRQAGWLLESFVLTGGWGQALSSAKIILVVSLWVTALSLCFPGTHLAVVALWTRCCKVWRLLGLQDFCNSL